ncbi:MAG: hypothetical protein HYZ75_09810 [Elusimicrobia bacterium]|nr:hypothetical protein [Elusimicrobiota bacterium]
MAGEREVLVGSGVFKVDRERALEKLMRFALPDPSHAVLLLVRCAAASEASRVRIRRERDGGLSVYFDGLPLSAEELASPYDALFQRASPKTRRARELSVALLTLLRLKPSRILVRSGTGAARAQLTVSASEHEKVEARPEDVGLDTAVKLLPGPDTRRGLWGKGFAEALRENCGMATMPIFLDDDRLASALPEELVEEGVPLAGSGLRGIVVMPTRIEPLSRLQFYRLGVRVGEVTLQLAGAGVFGRVDDPAFRLNASQTAVVRDERYKRALAAVEAAVRKMTVKCARLQAERAPALARLLADGVLYKFWADAVRGWLEPPASGLLGALSRFLADPPRADRELAKVLLADAKRVCWLREAASRAARGAADDPARAALSAPVYVSPDLSLRSHEELLRTAGALGYVPVARSGEPSAPGAFPVILLSGRAERESLTRLFPGVSAEDADAALDRARRLAGLETGSAVALERLGVDQVLVRRPLSEPWRGEVGLPLHRPDAARLHMFINGAPDQSAPAPADLRFIAVLDADMPLSPQRVAVAQSAVLDAIPSLYAAAAAEFSPEEDSSGASALRAHLLDALAWWAAKGAPEKLPTWLRTVPLFPCEAGLLDYQGLLTRFSWGETLFFLRRRARFPTPALSFRHESFTLEFLKRLLPGAEASGVPGRPDLRAAWRRPEKVPEAPLAEGDVLAKLEDLLRRRGTLFDAPQDPERVFVLSAVAKLFTPWIGAPRSLARWHRVREHLCAMPLVRRHRGGGWNPLQLDARLSTGRPFTYAAEGGAADAVLDEREVKLLNALWPAAQRTLAPAPAASPRKSRASATRRAADAAPAPAAAASGFEEPMLVNRELEGGTLRAWIGLPPEPLPGVSVTVVGGRKLFEFPLPTPGLAGAGRILLEVSAWQGPVEKDGAIHPALAKAAVALYQRFLCDLVDDWPRLAEGPAADGLRAYFLLFAAPRREAQEAWEPLRQRLEAAPLFPTLGGGAVSLADLRGRAQTDGCVRYAKAPGAAFEPADAGLPVVRLPRLASAALNIPLVAHEEQAAPAPASTGDPLLDALEGLLAKLRGRRGLDPAILPAAGELELFEGDGRRLMFRNGTRWAIDVKHPAARPVMEGLPAAAGRAPFLLSLLASAVNRESERATDAHDALLQVLLAESLDQSGAP